MNVTALPDRLPSRRRVPASRLSLSKRERDVLKAFLVFDTSEEVANELSISVPAVKKHLANMYARFGVRSKHRLLVACLKTDQHN